MKYDSWLFGRDGALLRAAALGDGTLARELLNGGADPNVASRNGFTPLHRAAEHGRTELVELLLRAGADPTRLNVHGQTPADLAAAAQYTDIAARLRD